MPGFLRFFCAGCHLNPHFVLSVATSTAAGTVETILTRKALSSRGIMAYAPEYQYYADAALVEVAPEVAPEADAAHQVAHQDLQGDIVCQTFGGCCNSLELRTNHLSLSPCAVRRSAI